MKSIGLVRKLTLSLLVVLSLTALSVASADMLAADPVGTWAYEVETPDGTLTGDMIIAKSDGEWSVTIESDVYGNLELEEISLEGDVMEASMELEGDVLDFEFEFDGDSMEGVVYAGEDELPISAERK